MQIYEPYTASDMRYAQSDFYRRCGNSGLMLPRLSFGLWHNFGNITPLGVQQQILRLGIRMLFISIMFLDYL
jgi:hypothetical protein